MTRVDPELWVAPDPGGVVYRASGEERDKALYVDEMARPLPIASAGTSWPVYADLDFFDGRKGGHMSISGISGVATKTSFALFFLRMLTGRPEIVGEAAANLRVLVFNVKGEDLLWLDKPNKFLDDHASSIWRRLGVDPVPFPSVSFWAPPRRQSETWVVPDTGGRQEGVDAFAWTPREFVDEGLLRFLFTDASDARNQLSFVEERVRVQLRRWAVDVAGQPGCDRLARTAARWLACHRTGDSVTGGAGHLHIAESRRCLGGNSSSRLMGTRRTAPGRGGRRAERSRRSCAASMRRLID